MASSRECRVLHACTYHLAALFGTAPTDFRAPLAVVSFVLFAFRATGIADFRTHTTEVSGELRSTTHESRCAPAGFGAVSVKSDAVRHFLDILLAQTGIGALFTCLRTFNTCLNAGLMFVSHESFSCGNNFGPDFGPPWSIVSIRHSLRVKRPTRVTADQAALIRLIPRSYR